MPLGAILVAEKGREYININLTNCQLLPAHKHRSAVASSQLTNEPSTDVSSPNTHANVHVVLQAVFAPATTLHPISVGRRMRTPELMETVPVIFKLPLDRSSVSARMTLPDNPLVKDPEPATLNFPFGVAVPTPTLSAAVTRLTIPAFLVQVVRAPVFTRTPCVMSEPLKLQRPLS